jgi:hypothetical protein
MEQSGKLFVGSQQQCREYLRSITGHYVYILRRPDGRPFYVGKGLGDRVFHHENEARHPNDHRSNTYKLNVIRSIWRSELPIQYEIAHIGIDEADAYAQEATLISNIRRLHEGGPLTNLAPGGGTVDGVAPASKEKHSATLGGIPDNNPERATLNGFVLGIANMASVVIKPAAQFVVRPTQKYRGKSMGPSLRQAVALVASAAANSVMMDDTCIIPRRVKIEDVEGCVENGVSCDILTSGMASIGAATRPADETFQLSIEQARRAVGLVGLGKCVDLGVLSVDTLRRHQV